jgi:hypothetical protein
MAASSVRRAGPATTQWWLRAGGGRCNGHRTDGAPQEISSTGGRCWRCYAPKLAMNWRDRAQGGEGAKVDGAHARTRHRQSTCMVVQTMAKGEAAHDRDREAKPSPSVACEGIGRWWAFHGRTRENKCIHACGTTSSVGYAHNSGKEDLTKEAHSSRCQVRTVPEGR